jgi:hypothetical protein
MGRESPRPIAEIDDSPFRRSSEWVVDQNPGSIG